MAGFVNRIRQVDYTSCAQILSDVSNGSQLVRVTRQVSTWVDIVGRKSHLYQWFTKDPESDMVTIDVRSSKIAGPFLLYMFELYARITRCWVQSRTNQIMCMIIDGSSQDTESE